MEDLKELMQHNYITYASYVILDRAIPNIIDGLKPVQRRILWTLNKIHDGKLHKVANVVGQTMAYHPHGDAPINDALVTIANKDYLLDKQGNFGNIYTGDPASAARYIETRLSPLAKETMFNPDLTETILSYDGRNREPLALPSKIPLLLMQGAEGIAVGMSTKVLPHNFEELLQAQINILEGNSFEIIPDFPTGGSIDASEYNCGNGKVKVRAKIEVKNDKTLIIKEICYGTTTESLTRSIDDAAKKGKIKIDSINDYTAENVEIEINLPRGQHAHDLIDELYAFTQCEVSISPQAIVIKDNLPWKANVHEILIDNTNRLKAYLKLELELERDRIEHKIFENTLEQIFIENKLYKNLEKVKSAEKLIETVEKSLKPYLKKLSKKPQEEDLQRLLNIPIRRISRFDIEKNQNDIQALENRLLEIAKDLKNMKRTTIHYIKALLKQFGKESPRLTKITEIELIDIKAVSSKNLRVGFDSKTGYLGTKVTGDQRLDCTSFDKILVIYDDGTYTVMNIPNKQYVQSGNHKVVYIGVADKETIFRAVYKDPKLDICYAKRFIISKFILDKVYEYFDIGMKLEVITTRPDAVFDIRYKKKPRLKIIQENFKIDNIAVKSVTAKGVRISPKEIRKVTLKS